MEREFDKDILELVSKPIRNDLSCLISISGHKLLKTDLVIFKVILRKWFKRFHTSQISRRLSLINSRINQFIRLDISNNFSNKLGSLIKEKYDVRTGKLEYPTYDHVAWIINCSIKSCEILCKTIRDIISVFEDCTLWIKLGHFARQMRIITAALSRLSVFFKTIILKICDVYPYLYTYLEMLDYIKLEEDQFNKDIFHYLKLINVDPPKNLEIKSSSKVKFKSMYGNSKRNDDIGEKVSRNLFYKKIDHKKEAKNCLNDEINLLILNKTKKSGGHTIKKNDETNNSLFSKDKKAALKKKLPNENQLIKIKNLKLVHELKLKRAKIRKKMRKSFQFEVE